MYWSLFCYFSSRKASAFFVNKFICNDDSSFIKLSPYFTCTSRFNVGQQRFYFVLELWKAAIIIIAFFNFRDNFKRYNVKKKIFMLRSHRIQIPVRIDYPAFPFWLSYEENHGLFVFNTTSITAGTLRKSC